MRSIRIYGFFGFAPKGNMDDTKTIRKKISISISLLSGNLSASPKDRILYISVYLSLSLSLFIYIYICIYMNQNQCVSVLCSKNKQKTRLFDEFSYSFNT